MKPTERDIHLAMLRTAFNMLSAERISFGMPASHLSARLPPVTDPSAIEAEVREIAERELKEKK